MELEQMQELLNHQKLFFKQGHSKDIGFRIKALNSLYSLIKSNEDAIIEALSLDLGKSAFEAYTSELGLVLEEIRLHKRKLKRWAKRIRKSSPLAALPATSYIQYEPYGISLIIAPWNYPFQLSIMPLIGAISAGNCAIIKPSETSPNTQKLISKLINAHFPANYIHSISADAEATKLLVQLPFDLIFFTGSSATGKKIMEAASKNLAKVVLELGGKSPVIIDDKANIRLTAKRIIWGKLINAGQTCIAPDYILVHHKQYQALIHALIQSITEFYGEKPESNPEYPNIINEANLKRLQHLLQYGKIEYGAKLNGRKLSPAILTEPDLQSALMTDEIFGPLLPVIAVQNMQEAIDFVQERPNPLALYIFSNNKHNIRNIITQISAGGVTINDTIMHFINNKLPFGGVGNSGMGSYHGKASFEVFSHQKSIMKRATFIDIPLRYPPFKNKLKIVKKIMK